MIFFVVEKVNDLDTDLAGFRKKQNDLEEVVEQREPGDTKLYPCAL